MLESLEQRCLLDAGMTGFVQTNLASSIPGLAAHTDKDLINPWGFSETPQGQFRISANGAGNAPLLSAQGKEIGKAVLLQPPLGSPPGTTTTPNGQAVNTTPDFVISDDGNSAPASVLFSTEDGTIIGFNPKIPRRVFSSPRPPTGRSTNSWPREAIPRATSSSPPISTTTRSTCSTRTSTR